MNQWGRTCRVTIAGVAALLGLTGCFGGSMKHGDELFEQTRVHNLEFKNTVAQAQSHIWGEEWGSSDYGDIAHGCDGDRSRFRFSMSRLVNLPELPEGIETASLNLGEWFKEQGWEGIVVRDLQTSIPTFVVEAHHRDSGAQQLMVRFMDSDVAAASALVMAESVCEPGDVTELNGLIRPRGFNDRSVEHHPKQEAPDDVPVFGHDEEGNLRPIQ